MGLQEQVEFLGFLADSQFKKSLSTSTSLNSPLSNGRFFANWS